MASPLYGDIDLDTILKAFAPFQPEFKPRSLGSSTLSAHELRCSILTRFIDKVNHDHVTIYRNWIQHEFGHLWYPSHHKKLYQFRIPLRIPYKCQPS